MIPSNRRNTHSAQSAPGVFPDAAGKALMDEDGYISLLIRFWRLPGEEKNELEGRWRSEVEHLQSGQHWEFSSVKEFTAALQDFLRRLG